MLSAIQRQGFAGHISCHFDGLLLRKSLVKSVEENNGMNLISFLQEAVSKQNAFQGDTQRQNRVVPGRVAGREIQAKRGHVRVGPVRGHLDRHPQLYSGCKWYS